MRLNHIRSGLGVAVLLAAVWALAALARPTSTYHLAPILIAGVVPFLHRDTGPSVRLQAALLGVAVAGATTISLAALGLLQGPSLLPYGGAAAEATALVAAGALVGLASGSLPLTDRP